MRLPLPEKTVRGFDVDGYQTAYAIRQSGDWNDMMDEILSCQDEATLARCRWRWAVIAVDKLWPPQFRWLAEREFDLAKDFIREWTEKRKEMDDALTGE